MKKKAIIVLALVALFSGSLAHAKPTNKQFVIGMSQEFETLNPIFMQMLASVYMHNLSGRTLTTIDADWKWVCLLCTEIPTFENKKLRFEKIDGKKKLVADWEIKEGAKWGDGTPLTAHDFAFTVNVVKSPNVATPEKEVYTMFENITVDKENPRKFRAVYDEERYAYYQLGTTYILPKHIEEPIWNKTKDQMGAYEKQTTYNMNSTNPGLYSGPYVISEVKPGSHIVYKRNPHFYGSKAKIDRIIVKVVSNTQALEANLLSGTIDMISELGIKLDQAMALEKRIAKNSKLKNRIAVQYRQGCTYEHINLNLENPILKDLRVRQALLYSLDRDKLVQGLFENKQKKALHSIHPLDPYFSDDVIKYPYDPKKAGSLFDAAGWKMGKDGYRSKNGKKMAIEIISTAGDKTRENVEVFLQNQWKKVGVDLKIKNQPARVFFSQTVQKAKYEGMTLFAWSSSPDNPPYSILQSKYIPTAANGHAGQNSGKWRNKKVDEALEKIRSEFDEKVRKQLMRTVQYEYTKEVPVIPLYMRASIAVVPTNLKNFRITGHQFMSTQDVENWDLAN